MKLVLLAVILLLVGCTSAPAAAPAATPQATATPTPGPSAASVAISGFAFNPATLTVSAGTAVAWTNEDSAPHDIKFVDSTSPTMAQGGTFSKAFPAAGTYAYSCGIHPSMKGTIVVT